MNTSFNKAYSELPGKDQFNVRDEIKEACGWNSNMYFYMKKNGTRALNEEEAKAVEDIFKKYGFDAWTGEQIKQTA